MLHLVIAYFVGAPDRVGHAARLDASGYVGRPHENYPNDPPLPFVEQRPGTSLTTSAFGGTSISRAPAQDHAGGTWARPGRKPRQAARST
ncbi:MAG TPA: hypothetical protein VM686_27605 [Polyangiaceae bacterium]|nr:hypothetical protein [Polyangiaceae bacterium]